MGETGEQNVEVITDIKAEFDHHVGNALVTPRTAVELSASGRVFDEDEDREWLDELRSAKEQLLARLTDILSSEFEGKGGLTRESISNFRDLISASDFANPDSVRQIVSAFEQLKGTGEK